MKVDAFVQLVTDMRAAQKKYFKQRGQANMLASMELEKQVDRALAEGIEGPRQLDLFAMENTQGESK